MRAALRREIITVAVAFGIALIAGSFLILLVGESPLGVYWLLIRKTWGQSYGFGQVLYNTTAYILTGLSFALAFKVGLFNIGAEGQMNIGCFVTGLCGAYLPEATPGVIAVPLSIAMGMAAGAVLGGIAGALKAFYGAHEVINTIMLNFIAGALVLFLGNTFFFAHATVRTEEIIEGAQLSTFSEFLNKFGETELFGGSTVNTSIVVAIAMAVLVYLFLTRTRRGYEWRAVGHNLRAAENGGINVRASITGAMAASGALAGACGASFVLGNKYFFEYEYGAGVGFMGIAVALVGRNHPVGIVAAALLFGTLSEGGLAVSAKVPKDLAYILQAIIILALSAVVGYMLYRQRRQPVAPAGGRAKSPATESAGGGKSDE